MLHRTRASCRSSPQPVQKPSPHAQTKTGDSYHKQQKGKPKHNILEFSISWPFQQDLYRHRIVKTTLAFTPAPVYPRTSIPYTPTPYTPHPYTSTPLHPTPLHPTPHTPAPTHPYAYPRPLQPTPTPLNPTLREGGGGGGWRGGGSRRGWKAMH